MVHSKKHFNLVSATQPVRATEDAKSSALVALTETARPSQKQVSILHPGLMLEAYRADSREAGRVLRATAKARTEVQLDHISKLRRLAHTAIALEFSERTSKVHQMAIQLDQDRRDAAHEAYNDFSTRVVKALERRLQELRDQVACGEISEAAAEVLCERLQNQFRVQLDSLDRRLEMIDQVIQDDFERMTYREKDND